MTDSSIEWTDKTWNPVRGCSRVSPGCDHCYAMGQAHRFSGPGKPYEGLTTIRRGKVDWVGTVRLVPEQLGEPLRWRKPQRVFVNSMSDLFHESLTNEEIAAVFGVMAACPRHVFQALTKRPKRMAEWFAWVTKRAMDGLSMFPEDDEAWRIGQMLNWTLRKQAGISTEHPGMPWPLPNVWLGVSVENQEQADKRIPLLLGTPAAVRFISAEPLLGPLDLSLVIGVSDHCTRCRAELPQQATDACPECDGRGCLIRTWGDEQAREMRDGVRTLPEILRDGPELHWVIAGGESGPGARPNDLVWHRSLRDQCNAAGVAFFEKQLGAAPQHIPEGRCFSEPLALASKKGGDMSQWPEDLRVREFPQGEAS